MAVTYRPFDSGAGADVTEDGWRKMARFWLDTGVLAGEDAELAVSERGAGAAMSVDVATGAAWLRGHHVESDAVENLPISAADPTDDRIDRIVVAADFVANTIALEVLEGVADPAPTAPALTQTAGRWEISLAQVLVEALAASIEDADITDERTYDTHIAHGEFAALVNIDNLTSATSHLLATSGRRLYDGSEVEIDVYVPHVARLEVASNNPTASSASTTATPLPGSPASRESRRPRSMCSGFPSGPRSS